MLKGVFALLMIALALRLRPVSRWWFAVNVVFFSAVSPDAEYLFVIALSACLLIESQLSPGLTLGVGVLFAFLSLTKFTSFLLCAASLAVVVAYAVLKRKGFRASGLALTYLACLLLFWGVAGQPVWGFCRSYAGRTRSRQGTPGRCRSTSRDWNSGLRLGVLLLGVGLFIGLARGTKEKSRNLAVLMVLCVSLFLAWKESFIRADYHHICTLFVFLLFAEPAAWALFHPPDNASGFCRE